MPAELELNTVTAEPSGPAAKAAPQRDVTLPPVLDGRFVLIERSGAGGMGVVFSAYDRLLDRKIALKVLVDDAPTSARVFREAKALARVSHPNVVQIFEIGEHEGRLFLAMEYIPGPTLAKWLAVRPRAPPEILGVFLQAGLGLVAAHESGLVHCDFKPANVIVGDEGRVRIVDFGLAREIAGPAEREPLRTMNGDVSPTGPGEGRGGTPRYMSPEQRRGEAVDARSDQYSFAVALREALEPASAGARGRVRRVLTVLQRGLEEDPRRRFPTMSAFCDALMAAFRPRRWPWIAVVLVLAASATLAWDLRVDARTGARCGEDDGTLASRWSITVRSDLRRHFAPVVPVLDTYVDRWSRGRLDACEATHVRGEQSAALLDLRMACLRGRLRELDALLVLLDERSSLDATRAVEAAASLPPVEQCADVDALLHRGTPDGRDPAAQEALAQARVLLGSHREQDAIAIADELLTRLPAASGARAETLLLRGQAHRLAPDHAPARQHLLDAYMSATALGRDDIAAEAAAALTHVLAMLMGRVEEAVLWDSLARANLQALGDVGLLRARVLHDLGHATFATAAHANGVADLEEALRIRERILGPRHFELALTLSGHGAALAAAGRDAEGVPSLERSRDMMIALFGPEHLNVAVPSFNLSHVYIGLGRVAEGLAEAERAVRVRARYLGPEHREVVFTRINLADALFEAGREGDALSEYNELVRLLIRSYGPDAAIVGVAELGVARCLRALGRPVEARAAVERSLTIARALPPGPVADEHVREALAMSAMLLVDLGDDDRALAVLAEQMQTLRGASEEPGLGPARFALARALWRDPDARAAALVLGRHARGSVHSPRLAVEIDAWLDARR